MKKMIVLGVTLAIAAFMSGCEKKRARSSDEEKESPKAGKEAEAVSFPAGEKTGDTMTITLPGGAKMEMVYVALEMPTKGFWMGKYEVTQAQWESVMGNNPSYFKGADRPVETVSWYDCQEFIKRVNAELGNDVVRLPTGEEWEYACRAGSTGDYCMLGNGTEITEDNLDEVAWHGREGGGETQPVGKKKPNSFGFYDMHGNVCEWCQDDLPGSDSDDASLRRTCGGSWGSRSELCQVSHVVYADAKDHFRSIGFRLCAIAVPGGRIMDEAAKPEAEEEVEAVSFPAGEKTGDTKTITLPGGAKMEMVYVASGSSMKGGEEHQSEMFFRRTTPAKGFWMGKYEVTQAQWESVMGNNPSYFKGADRPVEKVSWYDCQAFIQKVNAELEDGAVRLPTEAEWEYACRAGSTGEYGMRKDGTEMSEGDLDEVAWYGREVDGGTQPVGKKEPNAFGFYDMLGNVCEWCQDRSPGNDPASASLRRICGGSWDSGAEFCRLSQVLCADAKDNFRSIGFRLCATAAPRYRMDKATKTEAKKDEPAGDETAKAEAKKDVPAEDEVARDEPKKDDPAKDEVARDEPKKDETAKVENKKDEYSQDESIKPEARSDDYAKVKRESPKEERQKEESQKDYDKIAPLKEDHKTVEVKRDGDTMTITLPGGAKMVMIYVAPGSFMMGEKDKMPSRKVTLAKGFWMGKYEVTQAQWKSVMGNNPSAFHGDDKPVDNVSWNDCRAFAEKVNAKLEDGAVRLPTEAEWEYACRAGSTGDFGGTGASDDMGWYADNSGKETHSVGQKKPNEWGFHDMHGNTWEWCADYFPCAPVTNRTGSASGVLRALRGGCWDVGARYCRSAWRSGNDPGYRNRRYGFRLCYSAGRSE